MEPTTGKTKDCCNKVGLTINLGLQTPYFLAIPGTGNSLKVRTFTTCPLQR